MLLVIRILLNALLLGGLAYFAAYYAELNINYIQATVISNAMMAGNLPPDLDLEKLNKWSETRLKMISLAYALNLIVVGTYTAIAPYL
jgi:hypothetical protein